MATLMYFSEELLNLQEEMTKPDHHALHQIMSVLTPNADLGDKLEEVAAYCGVKCDGMYEEKELNGLCKLLTEKLRESRGAIEIHTSTEAPKLIH